MNWLEWLQELIGPSAKTQRRWLRRSIRLSGAVVAWLNEPGRTNAERLGLAELLLKLDADPVAASTPVLHAGAPAGMRWAAFPGHHVFFVWDMGQDQIRVALCTRV